MHQVSRKALHCNKNPICIPFLGIARPQSHIGGNWYCGRAILFMGIYLLPIVGIGSLQCVVLLIQSKHIQYIKE
jgi:hypothetical protein